MANLLTYKQSFDWTDRTVNRGSLIQDLSICINKAGEFKDSIYKSPDLHDTAFPWGALLLELASHDFDVFQLHYPWITQIQFQTLMGISYVLHATTPNSSSTFYDLDAEFPGLLNALIGFHSNCPSPLAHDLSSLCELHREYVSTFSFANQCLQYEYFIKFYTPFLKIDAGAIRNLINRRSVNPFIKRLDAPKFVHDKHHVHFNDDDNSALNIDGSWRHKSCQIPVRVRAILSNWGFILPRDCYF